MLSHAYTKRRLLKELAYKVGIRQELSQKILDSLVEIAYREAANEGFIIPGLCKFEVVERKARKVRNPRSGETLIIPPRKALKVTLSNLAKRSVAPSPRAIPESEYVPPAPPAPPAPDPTPVVAPVAAAPAVPPATPAPIEPPAPTQVPEVAAAPIETPAPEPTPTVAEAPVVTPAPVVEPTSEPVPEVAAVTEAPAAPVEPPKPVAPVIQKPDVPVPPRPVIHKPEAPAVPRPQAPVIHKPEAPAVPAPTASEAAKPEAPVAPRPQAPVIHKPVAPTVSTPEAPVAPKPEAPAPIPPRPKLPEAPKPKLTEAPQPAADEAPATPAPAPARPMLPEEHKQELAAAAAANPPEPEIPDSIFFKCPRCGQEIEAPGDSAGLEAECPLCGSIVTIPTANLDGSLGKSEVVSVKEAAKMDPSQLKNMTIRINADDLGLDNPEEANPTEELTPDQMIVFLCDACHQEIEASPDMAGTQVECPNCGSPLTVPAANQGPKPSDQPVSAAQQAAQKNRTMRINLDEF